MDFCLEAEKYVVVLEPGKETDGTIVMYLWTAYIVDSEHQHRKLMKSFKAFKIANAAFLRTAS